MGEERKVVNPFPGLRPFETDEYLLFFGREGQSDALVERLERARFLAVVGTSGSGKSSLVRAGLLPALRGGMMSGAGAGWRVAIMRPGHDPVGNLARALSAANEEKRLEKETKEEKNKREEEERKETGEQKRLRQEREALRRAEAEAVIEATLRRGSLGLVEAAYAARPGEREKLLVVADQFEELFRFRAARAGAAATDDDASAFVKLLLEAARQRELPIYVVLTMRSDFLGDCAQLQGLPEAINDGQYLIPRMTRDERRVAVVGPARVARGKMTEPLVNRLLNDVGDNPDQLPILQHALMRTWDYWLKHRRDSEPVGLEHYLAVGTMSEALSLHADEAYKELPDDRSRRVAELLFKALTERGADNREVRRPTRLREICEVAGASPAEVVAVVEVFRREGRSFLMPPAGVALTPETVIDISHESLIRNWARLREWVRDEGEGARIYRRLADAAAAHRAGEGGLLDDVTLGWVNRWRERYTPNRAWGVRYHAGYDEALSYLEESRLARAAEAADRERQREAEIERERREREQAEAFADRQRRTARRMRWLAVGMGVMFFLALAGAGYALTMGQRARTSEQRARDSEKLALAAKDRAEALYKTLQDTFASEKKAKEDAQQQKEIAEQTTNDLKKQKDIAEQNALQALNEKKRADEQARVAARNEVAARMAEIAASRSLAEAEGNARESKAAVERGNLIRGGLEAFQREDFTEAQQFFDNLAAKLDPLLPDRPRLAGVQFGLTPEQAAAETGWAYSYKGSAHRRAEELDEAAKAYEEALKKLTYLKDERDQILFDTYHGLGHVYHDIALRGYVADAQGEQQKIDAKRYFDLAREFYGKALNFQLATPAGAGGNTEEAADENANLARLFRDVGQVDDAEKHFIEAVRIRLGRSMGDDADGALDEKSTAALKELAEFYLGQGRLEDAVQVDDQLIDLEEDTYALEDGHVIADSYSDLGLAYNALSGKEKDQAKAKTLADKSEIAFRVANLLQQAVLTYRKESNAIEQGAGPVTLDDRMDELGDAYIKLGRFKQAEQIYTLALENVRLKVKANDVKRGQSYQKLGDLYNDYLKDAKKAQDYYYMLVGFYESRQRAGGADRLNYAVALDKLGKLYAKDPSTYSGAEERLTAAHKIFLAQGQLNSDSTLAALIDLYARQNREAELKAACDRRLDLLSRYLAENTGAVAPITAPRVGSAARIAVTYVKAAGEVADIYLTRNQPAYAEEAYARLFASNATIRNSMYDPARLAEYASLLKKYKALLSASNKPAELANVEKALNSVWARQDELRLIQDQQQQATQQSPTAQAAP
jgi:tetratricopeptide (TPR) repeat protein